jgi:BatD DUF11 like domain
MVSRTQSAERRTQKGWRHAARRFVLFCVLPSALCVLRLSANELSVDKTTLSLDDSLSIVVSLDGAFAALDSVRVPVTNLTIDGPPSTSSEISWINGVMTQRKIFRFVARPDGPGPATVGPLVIDAEGQRETLPAIAVQVLPDLAAGSNDPQTILRELLATHRDPFFVIAQVDRNAVFAGEELVVTWTLYNAATVQEWDVGAVPKLADFWSEDLDVRNEQPERVTVGPYVLQKLVVRRVALFPLHAGTLTIAPLEVRAAVMRRLDGGPFNLFEGSLLEISRRSAPIAIEAKPLPPGPAVDAIGDVGLTCAPPRQANGGPVVVDVAMSGRANLRSAMPPRWSRPLDGSAQVEEGKLTVQRTADAASMTRRWRLLVFPAHAGRFTLPPLVASVFSPANGRHELRCGAATLQVTTATAEVPQTAAVPETETRRPLWWLLALPLLLLAALALRRKTPKLNTRGKSPSELRDELHALLARKRIDEAALTREASDRGDAWRALRSLLDSVERDRAVVADPEREIEFRTRDFLQFLP